MNQMYDIRPIKDFPDYTIDIKGNIYSSERTIIRSDGKSQYVPMRKLKPVLNSSGYYTVALYRDKKRYTKTTHRLLAEHYITCDIENGQVNHIDGNKTNNSINNLEWVTASENTKHAYSQGLCTFAKTKINRAKLSIEQVLEIRYKYSNNSKSLKFIAKEYGVSRSAISRILRNERWTDIA
jgi:HNH endonuclease